ncbi:proprotein convertase P-domain-containing protein [Pyxidicoccus parkwayensis]|uniref:Proprotein convertase P-domain-containing protein n=1 Tax=Pyxidicoccus parkwayensis TaxID=2813578 RepID=A0ABX7PAT4_9BACT|nr:proprotein convertase P-domain-containing protein [Pyxidicoccus parkwaysis]QSQ27546.1 proprotein convertase P-domain-containing protein [Pyxidicoccus parkwaysis]
MTSRLFRSFAVSLGLPVALSCGAAPSGGEPTAALVTTQSQALLADSTPSATGVLSFLNDWSTTVSVLDNDVPLNAQAAQAIIAWRAGPDGIEHTADDRRFVSIAQVDAVPYVGPAALADLEWYAKGTGRVTGLALDELVGNFDGHDFTVAEARRTLKAANTVSGPDLQNVYGISALAVQDILAARPLYNMVKLSRLANVDFTVLQKFKAMTALAPVGDPCTGPGTCEAGLVCEGRPGDGSSNYGRCIASAPIVGDGDTCSVFAPCQAGLACHGVPSGAPEGWCRPAWMSGEFKKYAEVALPAATAPVESTQAVVGLATVPEDIIVEVDLVHSASHRLVLTLVDPSGDSALLWDGPNEGTPPSRISVTRGISRDASVNGYWLLRVTNPSGVGSGTLRSWKLKLTSRYD